MSTPRPPADVFCLACGPDAHLRTECDFLRCPRCGAAQRLPNLPLFVVTGASGTGKATIIEPLRRRLPELDVFDTDTILHVAQLGWDTWRNTLLPGSVRGRPERTIDHPVRITDPDQLDGLPARRLVGHIRFCNLDVPDAVLAERLRDRPAWRESSSDEHIAKHQQFAAWLRANIELSIDTDALDPAAVAARVAEWVERG